MPNLAEIKEYLAERNFIAAATIRYTDVANVVLLEIPRNLLRARATRSSTSKKQLQLVSKALEKEFGVKVLVAVRDSLEGVELETTLRTMLVRHFVGAIRDVYLTVNESNNVALWIELAGTGLTVAESIRNRAQQLLRELNVPCESVEILLPRFPQPSNAALLRVIKLLAPASLGEIRTGLERRELSCPSSKWLAARLDSVRKQGFVSRDSKGGYSLTAAGLSVVPHTRSRSSSDIERVLFLARRKAW